MVPRIQAEEALHTVTVERVAAVSTKEGQREAERVLSSWEILAEGRKRRRVDREQRRHVMEQIGVEVKRKGQGGDR